MNFFEHQAQAKRSTTLLIIQFLLAVVLIVVAIHLVVTGILYFVESSQNNRGAVPFRVFDWRILACTGGFTLFLVIVGSLSKIIALGGGGRVVAEMLGGEQIPPHTRNLAERQLLNIVEEMSIASGLRAPPVYVLRKEQSINAFAAGFSPDDAVVAVSEGALRHLNREEIQGVVAHEFSHILNGDMRLNIRLIGMIHGILLLGLMGRGMLRGLRHMRFRSSSGRSGKGGGGAAAAILVYVAVAISLWLIGSIGVIFGRLIKAAISRQREYLADASAVQFTRNPAGIAGALKKIGGFSEGSHIETPSAEQASHLFFGDAIGLSSMFATHPPLDERIRRIDPQWDGKYPLVVPLKEFAPEGQPQRVSSRPKMGGPLGDILTPQIQAATLAMTPVAAVAMIGKPTPAHLDHARSLIESIPEPLRDATREPLGAMGLIFGLLFDRDDAVRRIQMTWLAQSADQRAYSETLRLLRHMKDIQPEHRLTLIDLALPSLQQMSLTQFESFRASTRALIQADNRVNILELMIEAIVERNLSAHFGGQLRRSVKWYSLNGVINQCALVLSALAHRGNRRPEEIQAAFQAGVSHLGRLLRAPVLRPATECEPRAVAAALSDLAQVGMIQRKRVLEACVVCIAADAKISVGEAELLRAISAMLDLPMPPLLGGEHLIR